MKSQHQQDPEYRFEKWLKEFHPEEFEHLSSKSTINTDNQNFEGGGSEKPI